MLGGERTVACSVVVGHRIKRGIAAGHSERCDEHVSEHGSLRSAEEHESPDPHGSV